MILCVQFHTSLSTFFSLNRILEEYIEDQQSGQTRDQFHRQLVHNWSLVLNTHILAIQSPVRLRNFEKDCFCVGSKQYKWFNRTSWNSLIQKILEKNNLSLIFTITRLTRSILSTRLLLDGSRIKTEYSYVYYKSEPLSAVKRFHKIHLLFFPLR